jgi:hypothetical protein
LAQADVETRQWMKVRLLLSFNGARVKARLSKANARKPPPRGAQHPHSRQPSGTATSGQASNVPVWISAKGPKRPRRADDEVAPIPDRSRPRVETGRFDSIPLRTLGAVQTAKKATLYPAGAFILKCG